MNTLNKILTELESNISKQDTLNTDVSQSNVGWHIEHALLTINGVIKALEKSDPSNYKWSFRIPRLIVFTINKIPRQRAKSPKAVVPKIYDEATLKAHVEKTKNKIQELNSISKDKYFDHPFFGNLKVNKTIKFLKIHTNHHLKIINDILNQ